MKVRLYTNEEIKKLNNKKKRLKEGFVNELFTIEEFKEETEKLDNLIKELEEKIISNQQAEQLNFTVDDILLKRDMDYINKTGDMYFDRSSFASAQFEF